MRALRFDLEETRYAVPLERVVEVAPRVLFTPLPGLPPFVLGLISYRREVCIAIGMRLRLGHAPRKPSLDEHVLVVRGRRRLLGLVVDRVLGDEEIASRAIAPASAVHGGRGAVSGMVALEDGVLLVQDVDALLDDAQEAAIDASLAGASS